VITAFLLTRQIGRAVPRSRAALLSHALASVRISKRRSAQLGRFRSGAMTTLTEQPLRTSPAAASVVLLALPALACAEPPRACEQVSALVDAAIRPLLAKQTQPSPDTESLAAQVGNCLRSHNMCTVAYNTRHEGPTLLAADVTADLPQQDLSQQGRSSVLFLLRSIPRVRNDTNQYCLVSAQLGTAASPEAWNVYGWVIAPKASEALPLQMQVLNDNTKSDPRSLRGLAAALWFFAERMSGQPPPPQQ